MKWRKVADGYESGNYHIIRSPGHRWSSRGFWVPELEWDVEFEGRTIGAASTAGAAKRIAERHSDKQDSAKPQSAASAQDDTEPPRSGKDAKE